MEGDTLYLNLIMTQLATFIRKHDMYRPRDMISKRYGRILEEKDKDKKVDPYEIPKVTAQQKAINLMLKEHKDVQKEKERNF